MKNFKSLLKASLIATLLFTATSCATRVAKPKQAPQPSTIKFSKFKKVELKEVTLDPKFAKSEGNKKVARKINHLVRSGIEKTLSQANVKGIQNGEEFSKDKNVLRIIPEITSIRFVNKTARAWGGFWAGNSRILIKVTYIDSSSGKIIAEPEFYQSSNGFNAERTNGATDTAMLQDIADDIVEYTSYNK